MNNKYIEVNSQYRDRNIWPIVGQFEIPISQSGTKSAFDALDPVCLSTPLFAWRVGDFSYTAGGVIYDNVICNVLLGTVPTDNAPITYTADGTVMLFRTGYTTDLNTAYKPQDLDNYFSGLVLKKIVPGTDIPSRNRIIDYKLLGLITKEDPIGTFNYAYKFQITLDGKIDYIDSDQFIILDPTDISDPVNPLFFVPDGRQQANSYSNYILYNETINDYVNIISYDNVTRIVSTDPIDPTTWVINDMRLNIRKDKPLYPPRLLNNLDNPTISSSSTPEIIILNPLDFRPSQLSEINDFYNNCFLRILSIAYNYEIAPPQNECRRITSYTYQTNGGAPSSKVYTFTVYPPFNGTITANQIEILPFSFDNFNPFVYNGSLVSQQEIVCYEIELMDLVLPNGIITTGTGSRSAFYPFMYVELANVSDSNGGNKYIMYSNNPNSTKMVFRVPIIDIQDPISTPFVRVTGNGVVQTMKFKPNDNLLFSVRLPNGDIFDTEIPEYYSPSEPNFYAQVSALFRITRKY